MKIPSLIAVVVSLTLLNVAWAQTELISDDKFTDQGLSWNLRTASEAVAELSVEGKGDDAALKIEVDTALTADGESGPDVRVQKVFGAITEGKEYKVTFQARAKEPVTLVSYIYPEQDGSRVLWRLEFQVGEEWKDFEYTFTGKENADECVLGFAKLGQKGNTYAFRHVVLTEQ